MSDDAHKGFPNPGRLKVYQDLYQNFHIKNPKRLSGKFPQAQVDAIVGLVRKLNAERSLAGLRDKPRLLDYGSGKGYQYLYHRSHEKWGDILPYCWDPGVIQLGRRPLGTFDGVICTDVLEHIEKQDLRDTLMDIFNYITPDVPSFLFLQICCRPAGKSFPDGRNLHMTVQEPKWWDELIAPYRRGWKKLTLEISYHTGDEVVEG